MLTTHQTHTHTHTHLQFVADHLVVKLIRIAVPRLIQCAAHVHATNMSTRTRPNFSACPHLLVHAFELCLLPLIVLCSEDIVLVLLQQAQVVTRLQLEHREGHVGQWALIRSMGLIPCSQALHAS